jgi:transposase
MVSTGVLWRSPYEALEDVGFTTQELMLVNARDVKGIIGRKTDREDAVRLAQIARMGIIKASSVPPRIFREMRLIVRRYQTLKRTTANLTNVYQKLLNAAGLRASCVFSDVRGLAATAILEAKLNDAPDFAETVIDRILRA